MGIEKIYRNCKIFKNKTVAFLKNIWRNWKTAESQLGQSLHFMIPSLKLLNLTIKKTLGKKVMFHFGTLNLLFMFHWVSSQNFQLFLLKTRGANIWDLEQDYETRQTLKVLQRNRILKSSVDWDGGKIILSSDSHHDTYHNL